MDSILKKVQQQTMALYGTIKLEEYQHVTRNNKIHVCCKAFGLSSFINNNNNNKNNNIDSYIAHFYPQCTLHYESRLKIITFLAYVTLYIKYCKT